MPIVADNYSAASGATIYGGRAVPSIGAPAWLSSQALNTWALVPGATLSSVNPANNPAVNPIYPSPPEWVASGHRMIVDAWCGMAVNYATGDVWLGSTGGHADYAGNEMYKAVTFAAAADWAMVHAPSGAIGYPITDGGFGHSSVSGLYSDGRPRPTHTYNALVYVPGLGFVNTNLYYVFPDVNGPGKAYLYKETTSEWELFCDYTALGNCNAPVSGACYDSLRHCIWILAQGAYNMLKIDCTTKVASRHGVIDNHAENPILKYDAASDLVYIVSSSSGSGWLDNASHMTAFDPTTDVFHVIPVASGSLPAGMAMAGHAVGWDEENGRLLIWGAQTDRAKIGTLTRPGGNPRTTAWVAGALTLSGSNAVTPTVPTTNGTFGRGDFVPALGGYLLLNATTQQFYFFKTKVIA